jgi:hypothetical protein
MTGTVVCIPVFDDWDCVIELVNKLDRAARDWGERASVLVVDDGSKSAMPKSLPRRPESLSRVNVLRLRRNVGHQRAIALGLAYVHANWVCDHAVVMDGDGEDAPEDIAKLLDLCRKSNDDMVIFAKRAKRSEGLVFRAGYRAFKLVHRFLTGRNVEVGNFSAIPYSLLDRVVGVSEIWNHFAAGIYHARLPVRTVPIERSTRLRGRSKMNLVSLVSHGMSAISVYGDVVGVRLLWLTSVLSVIVLAGLFSVVGLRLFTNLAIPGWATNAAGLLAVVFLNFLLLSMVFVLFILHGRNIEGFVPVRDWHCYVLRVDSLHG